MTEVLSQVGDLGKAIEFFNRNSEGFSKVVQEIREKVDELKNLKTGIHNKVPSNKPEVEDSSLGHLSGEEVKLLREIESQTKGISALSGLDRLSSDLAKIQLQIGEVHEAQYRGLISHKEASQELEKLESLYSHIKSTTTGLVHGLDLRATHWWELGQKAAVGSVGKQLSGLATGTLGLLSSFPVVGGLFGLLLYGYMERNRMQTEAGEMLNALEANGEKVTNKTLAAFSAFQQRAQDFYSMNRQEVQAIVKDFVQAGQSLDAITESRHRDLGEVGANVVSLTLGVDKLFEVGSGFTAKAAVTLTDNHGISLATATEQILRTEFAAHRAGVSIKDLTNMSVSVSDELDRYGIQGESVSALMLEIVGDYQTLGLNPQVAMSFAMRGMQEMTSGLSGMNIGIKTYLGESLNLGHGLNAAYQLQDKIASDDATSLIHIVASLNTLAEQETKGTSGRFGSDSMRRRAYLESLGFGFEGSRMLEEITVRYGHRVSVGDLTQKEWSELKNAFTDEGQKTSENLRNFREALRGFSLSARGLLKLFGDFAGFVIVSLKSIMAMQISDFLGVATRGIADKLSDFLGIDIRDKTAPWKPKSDRDKVIYDAWHRYSDAIGGDIQDIMTGAKSIYTGISKVAAPLAQPMIDALGVKTTGKPGEGYTLSHGVSTESDIYHTVYDNEVRVGGTVAWRNNNPGNITYGAFAKAHGAIGRAGRWAVFPDEATGIRAIESLLETRTYQDRTILEGISIYAPSTDRNDPVAYARNIQRLTGLDPTKMIRDLSTSGIHAVAQAIKRVEGWVEGTAYAATDHNVSVDATSEQKDGINHIAITVRVEDLPRAPSKSKGIPVYAP